MLQEQMEMLTIVANQNSISIDYSDAITFMNP